MKRLTIQGVALWVPLGAMAHEGHGLPGVSHWHAGDALGFALAMVVVALIWWGGRNR